MTPQSKHDIIDAITTLQCASIQAWDSPSVSDTCRNAINYLAKQAKLSDSQKEIIRIASNQAWIIGRRQRGSY